MILSKYCKQKGYTLEQYENLKKNIENAAQAIASNTSQSNTGMYYPVNNILTYAPNNELKPFIIQELKKLGFEFIEDYTLYRY